MKRNAPQMKHNQGPSISVRPSRLLRGLEYVPVWEEGARYKYAVKALWADTLWKHRKLSHDKYREYVISCREDVRRRLQNLDAVVEREQRERMNQERARVIKRIRAGFQPFKQFPELQRWRALFEVEADRYPILIVLGPSRMGKTELIKSLFRNPCQVQIGGNKDFPDAFRKFDRDSHDGLILDDVRDCQFFVDHQDVFQSKYDADHEFASTTSGQYGEGPGIGARPALPKSTSEVPKANP